MKKFEELNVIDDFMFNELMTQESEEKSEEFCRSILEPIIEKKIGRIKIEGQRGMQGVDTEARGVKLDAYIKVYTNDDGEELADIELQSTPVIYDLEPNNRKTCSDEKRSRLYHSLIDSNVIKSGIIYSEIPDVMVIMILPYDPFDRNRMVYTVKKYCTEELDMLYEDGDTTIYLYAYGTKEIPSQRLADMLKFMVESTRENAEKAGLENIQTMLEDIKRNSKIGVKYVQSWEEKMYYTEKGYKEGHEAGVKEGRQEGIASGIRIKYTP